MTPSTEAHGGQQMLAGDCCVIPPQFRASVIDTSTDVEFLEVFFACISVTKPLESQQHASMNIELFIMPHNMLEFFYNRYSMHIWCGYNYFFILNLLSTQYFQVYCSCL